MPDEDKDVSSEEQEATAVLDESAKDDEEEESPFALKIDDEEEKDKDDKDKTKGKSEKKDDEPDEKDKEIAQLKKDLEKAKKDRSKAFYEARQAKKETGPETKAGQLTKAQLKQILEDNKDDPDTLMNVVEYIAEQTATGISSEKVNAAEVNRKKGELDSLLADRYPDINDPGSDIRVEVDAAKKNLGLETHPYGDYFATAAIVFDGLPDLLEDAYKKGKGETGDTAEEKRKKDIKAKKLPTSKGKATGGESLTASQLETAKQMGLKGDQLKHYKKLVGKNPRIVSVED